MPENNAQCINGRKRNEMNSNLEKNIEYIVYFVTVHILGQLAETFWLSCQLKFES